MFWLLCCVLLIDVAPAGTRDGEQDYAEYSRLTEEIRSLAMRNAWDGVERAYQQLLETDVPPTDLEYIAAAQAAASRGDITECRARLILALEIADVQEYRDWLARIEEAYGPVSLQGDPNKVDLAAKEMPFDPAKATAIQFAIAHVYEFGSYEGLLPQGDYIFGGFEVKVQPGVSKQSIDIRSDKFARKQERLKRKLERQEKKNSK